MAQKVQLNRLEMEPLQGGTFQVQPQPLTLRDAPESTLFFLDPPTQKAVATIPKTSP